MDALNNYGNYWRDQRVVAEEFARKERENARKASARERAGFDVDKACESAKRNDGTLK